MNYVLVTIFIACAAAANAMEPPKWAPCAVPSIQKLRSETLQRLFFEDQNDYRKYMAEHPDKPIDASKFEKMGENDLKRRKAVANILAEGCFKTSSDYSAAAMIYQHGIVPDHFFQAFSWAKQAITLGDETQKSLLAEAIDRYLVNIGHKQLFGSQATKPQESTCWCLQSVEESFPDTIREQYNSRSLSDAVKWVRSMNGGNNCPEPLCSTVLKPSPKGTVLGFW